MHQQLHSPLIKKTTPLTSVSAPSANNYLALRSADTSKLEAFGCGIAGMTKVYPNSSMTRKNSDIKSFLAAEHKDCTAAAAVLTVWKKSLLFNCNGFTVFDAEGDLLFRVDNYMDGHKGEILLMDAAGNPLLTIRRKRLSLGDCWMVYDRETDRNPRLSVRKHVNIFNSKCLAYVSDKNIVLYNIEGSYAKRCCSMYDSKRRKVAEIKCKESVRGVAFGVDVFHLIVQPGLDSATAMALVILLDQMFGSNKSFSL